VLPVIILENFFSFIKLNLDDLLSKGGEVYGLVFILKLLLFLKEFIFFNETGVSSLLEFRSEFEKLDPILPLEI
jgi:hypothetical protein